ncbi:MAG: hypothetical protein K2L92_05800 [Muribaculaceae bacterium]|nr:hypothetical protein [Muribaculaceae bacterium]MDE6564324.1 hypothetical protein [Muribaculaceae bacterium]
MSEEEKLALVDNLSAGLKFNYRRILLQKARMGRSVVIADADGMPKAVKAKKVLHDLLSSHEHKE